MTSRMFLRLHPCTGFSSERNYNNGRGMATGKLFGYLIVALVLPPIKRSIRLSLLAPPDLSPKPRSFRRQGPGSSRFINFGLIREKITPRLVAGAMPVFWRRGRDGLHRTDIFQACWNEDERMLSASVNKISTMFQVH